MRALLLGLGQSVLSLKTLERPLLAADTSLADDLRCLQDGAHAHCKQNRPWLVRAVFERLSQELLCCRPTPAQRSFVPWAGLMHAGMKCSE